MLKLYKHQQELIDLDPKRWLMAHGTGTGKTVTAIKLCEGKGTTLVVVPKSIKEQWYESLGKFLVDSVDILNWSVITKEEFRRDYRTLGGYDNLIIDEGHHFLGHKSAMYKHAMAYLRKHKPVRVYLLTATPYRSSPFNIMCAGNLLGMNKKSWYDWKVMFYYDVRMGARSIPMIKTKVNGKPITEVIAKMVRRMGNAVSIQDCADVPEQTHITEYFDLTAEQKKAIRELDDIVHIARWTHTHQICGGTKKGDKYNEDEYYKSEKLGRLLELAKENDKLFVVCRYNNELKFLKEKLAGYNVEILNGETKNRHEIIKKAEASDKFILLVQAKISEGYECPSFPIMIFYSMDFGLVEYTQIIGRILRLNKLKKNVYIYFVVKDTIDADVKKCIDTKKSFDIAIYNNDK